MKILNALKFASLTAIIIWEKNNVRKIYTYIGIITIIYIYKLQTFRKIISNFKSNKNLLNYYNSKYRNLRNKSIKYKW